MKIKAFEAIRVHPAQEHQLSNTAPQTVSVALGLAPDELPLKVALETVARQRPETIEGQANAYGEIKESMQAFLEMGSLQQDPVPGIFVYESLTESGSQTGIWCLAEIEDYVNGLIKVHELTFGESVRRLEAYRAVTGLEGSPVLLAYEPNSQVNRIMEETKKKDAYLTLGNHRLWKIEDLVQQSKLIQEFEKIDKAYLADGHHRLASAARLMAGQKATERRMNKQVTALYMATDELQIRAYHRVVVQDKPIDKAQLYKLLSHSFYIAESFTNRPIQPKVARQIGMLIEGQWYQLTAKHEPIEMEPADADILQDKVFAAFFGIADPKNDERLKYFGGEKAIEQITEFVAAHPFSLVFTLSALPVADLIAVADAGGVLPPKSTWIDPKIPYGLLLYQFQPNS